MKTHPAALRLCEVLAQQLRDRGVSASVLSRELGHQPAYLSRVLSGRRPLRVEVVFEILARLSVAPSDFFALAFPFAGDRFAGTQLSKDVLRTLDGVPSEEDSDRELVRKRELFSSTEYTLRLGALVQRELQRRRVPMAKASRQLGLGSSALSQALRGRSQLTFLHVLGALELADADPGRVFVNLFLLDVEDPLERARRDDLLLLLEETAREGKAGFLLRRERRERALAALESRAAAEEQPGEAEAGADFGGADEPEETGPSASRPAEHSPARRRAAGGA